MMVRSISGAIGSDVINGNAAGDEWPKNDGFDVRPLLMYTTLSSAPKAKRTSGRVRRARSSIYKILGAARRRRHGLNDLMSWGGNGAAATSQPLGPRP